MSGGADVHALNVARRGDERLAFDLGRLSMTPATAARNARATDAGGATAARMTSSVSAAELASAALAARRASAARDERGDALLKMRTLREQAPFPRPQPQPPPSLTQTNTGTRARTRAPRVRGPTG